MPRIRTVKPDHWNDKELPKISLQAHLLWIGTWNFSDDSGVFENDPLLIRSQIFPRRTDIRTEQIASWLDQLEKARYIIPFSYKDEGYYISRTFGTHQRIDKPTPSRIPEEILRTLLERSANGREDSPLYSSGEESSVKDGNKGGKPPPATEKFEKPGEMDLTDYFTEIGLETFLANEQARLFLDWFDGNGWKVGKAKTPMKDWRAAARTWKHRMNDFKNDNHESDRRTTKPKPGTSEARIEVARKW